MKALLLHCRHYHVETDKLSNRPEDIEPEPVTEPMQDKTNCIVVLVTIEESDSIDLATGLAEEVEKMSADTGSQDVVLLPFAHLSNSLADSQTSLQVLDKVSEEISVLYAVTRGHFGSHKELLVDIFGHPGNVRFREF